jgi:hypothetical protein
MRPPQELLYESESSLRLVDKAIEELGAEGGTPIDIAGMLDGLSRAVSLAKQLDGPANASEAAASLREELNSLSSHLHAVAEAMSVPLSCHPEDPERSEGDEGPFSRRGG